MNKSNKSKNKNQNDELKREIEKKFINQSKFSQEIEKIVCEENVNHIEAIVMFCELNGLDIEGITKLISKPLKERLKCDAIRLNFMKKTTRAKLPL
jgi:ATP-dependent Clp protease ATP-binding subunit ClpA